MLHNTLPDACVSAGCWWAYLELFASGVGVAGLKRGVEAVNAHFWDVGTSYGAGV